VTWSDAALAGAFVLGAVGGTVASVRIMRYVLEYMRTQRDA